MPTAHCLPKTQLDFHPFRRVDVEFDSPTTSSDGGALLLRQLDERLGLTAGLAAFLPDTRAPNRIVHSRLEQLRQRVYQIALGYEDQNDATSLRHDPLMRAVCDRLPEDGHGLSSQPSLSRFEHSVSARDVVRMQRYLEDDYVASLPNDTTHIILDIDATNDPTHGQQPLSFYNAHYGEHMYFPLLVFDQDGRLASARLRPGNAGNNRYATPLISRLVRKLKKRFPDASILVRADAGFCTPRLLEKLESLSAELGRVDFVIGVKKNPVLVRLSGDHLATAAELVKSTGQAARVFTSVRYRARSWDRERYVVAKAEQLGDRENPRFVITSLDDIPPRMLYERVYCARGNAENRIKDFKRALTGDRLSGTTYVVNAFRWLLHATAYRLMHALRTETSRVSNELGRAQFDTLRLRFLKVAAVVKQSTRRIAISLPQAFGLAKEFIAVASALVAA